MLAGTDRLDKDLMIAQMQGKLQVVMLPSCGHCIQEDAPGIVAGHLMAFKARYKLK